MAAASNAAEKGIGSAAANELLHNNKDRQESEVTEIFMLGILIYSLNDLLSQGWGLTFDGSARPRINS